MYGGVCMGTIQVIRRQSRGEDGGRVLEFIVLTVETGVRATGVLPERVNSNSRSGEGNQPGQTRTHKGEASKARQGKAWQG